MRPPRLSFAGDRRVLFPLLVSIIFFFAFGLFLSGGDSYAMWATLTDKQLVAKSDLIVMAELIGQTEVKLAADGAILLLGVLQVEEVLKGDRQQTAVLLVLPSPGAPRASTDILYRKGQRGLWFLRARTQGESGLYLADHPQRFLSATREAGRIEEFRRVLQAQSRD